MRRAIAICLAITALTAHSAPAAAAHGMKDNMNNNSMLDMPMMDAARGRTLFASKGCVVCHSVNGVGGTDAPALDANTMQGPMNPFEFAARMWRGAEAMIAMQQSELGYQIELTGQDLADIIAFVHSPAQQSRFTIADVPEKFRRKLKEGD